MENIITKMRQEKQEYNEQMKRVAHLPKDYQFVYDKIQHYMWNFSTGMGSDMMKTLYDLIDLFEEAANEGRHVLDVTGNDVATFCDNLMSENKLWTKQVKNKLNDKIKKKIS